MKRSLLRLVMFIVMVGLILSSSMMTFAASDGSVLLLSQDEKWDLIVEQGKKEGKVIFYVFCEDQYFKEAAPKFKAEYGIEVKIFNAPQNSILDKLMAEAKRSEGTVDMILIGGQNIIKGLNRGLFYGPILEMVPNYKYLDPTCTYFIEGTDIQGMLVPAKRDQTCFVYNPDKVTNPPQTVEELAKWIKDNPKKFGYCPPNSGGSGQAFVTGIIYALTGGETKYKGAFDEAKTKNWDIVWDWLNEIEPNIRYGNSNGDILDKLNMGEIWLAPNWEDMVSSYMRDGTLFKNAKAYLPEGIPMCGGADAFALINNATHKAAALVFINYLISDFAQAEYNKMLGVKPVNVNAEDVYGLIPYSDIFIKGGSWFNGDYKELMINSWMEKVGRE